MKNHPQVLKGTRDFLPQEAMLRRRIAAQLSRAFESFGFEPLETPAIEYAETLEGKFGPEADKLIYRFQDRGGRDVGLRYDLTVPLARVVAMNPELTKPFKRYQIAPVWRAEKPQRGRYREFWQCDFDIVGSTSLLADAEIVQVTVETLRALGLREFTVKINNRKVLAAIGLLVGASDEQAPALYRALDKLEKIGGSAVREELAEIGLAEPAIERLLTTTALHVESAEDFARLQTLLNDVPGGPEAVSELAELMRCLAHLGVPAQQCQVDLSMVRGLDYYTGPIFETVVLEPRIGSISGGGRYDRLAGMVGPRDTPAVGASFGLDRLLEVLETAGLLPSTLPTATHVLITVFDPSHLEYSAALAGLLRQSGLNAELYLGNDKLSNQLRYAARKGIPFAVIAGPDEISAGQVVLKDLTVGRQRSLPVVELGAALESAILSP